MAPRAPSSRSASRAPPFGWPKDAVNGAIFTLLAAGNIRAAQDGKDLAGPKELPPTQIGKVTLYKEDEPPSVGQRLAVKGLLTAAGIAYEPGQEGAQLSALLQRLKDLAGRAGGPPPLPEPPDTDHLDALLALGGNQRFRAVADDHDRLSSDLERWRAADQQREKREREWHDLQRLLRHADGLPIVAKVAPASAAIRDGRQLLQQYVVKRDRNQRQLLSASSQPGSGVPARPLLPNGEELRKCAPAAARGTQLPVSAGAIKILAKGPGAMLLATASAASSASVPEAVSTISVPGTPNRATSLARRISNQKSTRGCLSSPAVNPLQAASTAR